MPGLATIKRIWAPLFQTAAWLAGLVGGLVVSPPMLWAHATATDYVRITQVVLAFAVGLVFLAGRGRTRGPRPWIAASVAGLALALALFFLYGYLMAAWTCAYANHVAVRGSEYLPGAVDYSRQHPELTCSGMIRDYVGATNQIWPESQLINRQIGSAACFMLFSVSLSTALMSLVEALRLGGGGVARRAGGAHQHG